MKKIHVIPNGYDAERFYPRLAHKFKEKLNLLGPLIFFCGKFDYPPNKEAVYTIRWQLLHRVLAKLPRAKFVIVGGGYEFDLEHPAMLFTGPVKNIEDYLAACDIVIAPLRAGGGTRIKILEAIACGKVVVATSMAAQGLVNKLTKPAIKLATDWDAFARLVVSYLGREVEVPKRFKEYAWSSLFRRFDKLLEGL
jgi:glycosyltransferase involved in cell wall biosynthesis